jgi:hypothetical protein
MVMTDSTEKDFDLLASRTEARAAFFRYLREDHQNVYVLRLAERLIDDARRIVTERKPTPQIASRVAKGYYRLAVTLLQDLQAAGQEIPEALLQWPLPGVKTVKVNATVVQAAVPTLDDVLPEAKITKVSTLDDVLPDLTQWPPATSVTLNRAPVVELPDLDAVAREQEERATRAIKANAVLSAFNELRDDFFAAPLSNVIRPPVIRDLSEHGEKILLLQTAKFTHAGHKCNWNAVVDNRVPTSGHALVYHGFDGRAISDRAFKGEDDDRYIRVLRVVDGTLLRYFLQIDDRNADQHARYFVVKDGVLRSIAPKEFWTLEANRRRSGGEASVH